MIHFLKANLLFSYFLLQKKKKILEISKDFEKLKEVKVKINEFYLILYLFYHIYPFNKRAHLFLILLVPHLMV